MRYLLSIMKGQQKGFVAQLITFLLLPCSLIYWFGVCCHQNYYRLRGPYKASKPVISIGNITLGGSGKTPLVIWLVRYLQAKGFNPVILTRGYMPKDAKESDEVKMLNEQIPHIPILVGGNRVANIRKTEGVLPVDVYICDDAFQHWPLQRDLNIVTIDVANPFGSSYLLPAGILREPLSSLKRADVLILTKTEGSGHIQELSSKLKEINPKALIIQSWYKSAGVKDVFDVLSIPENFLKDKRVVGFCAIGDPLSFELSVKNSGAELIKFFAYMDHHVYQASDIKEMVDFCRSRQIQVLVTTHKDAVKLRIFKNLFAEIHVVFIPIKLEITKGADEFAQKIMSICLS